MVSVDALEQIKSYYSKKVTEIKQPRWEESPETALRQEEGDFASHHQS